MTTTTDQQLDRLGELLDRADITDLIDRFLRGLDERTLDLDWGRSMFADDVQVVFPIGEETGLDAVVGALATGMARFGPTQHLGANHVIDLHGDRATVRWNATQTHLPPDSTPFAEPFVSGGYYDGEVVRTGHGWRLRRIEYHIVWLAGEPPLST